MEEENKNKNSSSFWLGLLIGAVMAGLLVFFLEKDKKEKENLMRNLKNDWEGVLEKIKELVGDTPLRPSTEFTSSTVERLGTSEGQAEKSEIARPRRKFFKKAGKILH